jgi:preprotein translocase subunit SecG
MYILILIIHILICIFLILIVLLQASKDAGLSGLFGGGGSEAIFGGTSGNIFLRKVTTVLAIIFMCTSLILTFISLRQPRRTVTEKIAVSPATPALPPGHPQVPTEETKQPSAETPQTPTEQGNTLPSGQPESSPPPTQPASQ